MGMSENPYLAVVVIQLLTFGVPSLFYCRLRGREFSKRLRLRAIKPLHILYVAYSALFMICGVMLLSVLMYNISPDTFAVSSVDQHAAFAMNGGVFNSVYIFLTFALLPAFCEEFLFRGIMLGEYETVGGASIAISVSALMFAMSHFSLIRLPVYLFAGLVLGAVCYATRSVLACIIVHTLNNSVVLFCEDYVIGIAERQNVGYVLLLVIFGAVFIISGMLMCYEAHNIYRDYAENNVESDYAAASKKNIFGRISESFFTPTFLLATAIFVLAAIARM